MIYQLLGLCLFIIGLSHKLEPVLLLEYKIARWIQDKFSFPPLIKWLEELWILGRTRFALIALILLTGYDWKLGLPALIVFGVIAGIEKLVKMAFNRPRPFSDDQELKMLQPRKPIDPSFPSGDALRIWFLVLLLSFAIGSSLTFVFISTILAVLISVSRMIFGVHFLTDVLAGAGLGFIGAGTTIWLWQLFHIL